MFVPIALHIGGNFGPAGLESTSDVQSFLVIWMYLHCIYQIYLDNNSLNLMEFPDTSKEMMEADACDIKSNIDAYSYNICCQSRNTTSFYPFYCMFIDNGGTAGPQFFSNIMILIASSIKACYLLLGYPSLIQSPYLPPTMLGDKMGDCEIWIKRVYIGKLFKTKKKEISIENYKVQQLLHIIKDTWNDVKKIFEVLDAARLLNSGKCSHMCNILSLATMVSPKFDSGN